MSSLLLPPHRLVLCDMGALPPFSSSQLIVWFVSLCPTWFARHVRCVNNRRPFHPLDHFTPSIKQNRQVSGPYNCAQFTIELYRNLVGSCKWGTAGQLMDAVREVGKELVAAKPSELAVGNMVSLSSPAAASLLSTIGLDFNPCNL